jgi:hypothetical protein
MATKTEKTSARKKSGGNGGSSAKSMLRSVVGAGVGTDTLIDLVERLGLVDMVVDRVRSRIEETDVDEVMNEATEYLRRNPEVLVVTLGAVTIATGLLVWLNSRREWDGSERRNEASSSRPVAAASAAPGRVRRPGSARSEQ